MGSREIAVFSRIEQVQIEPLELGEGLRACEYVGRYSVMREGKRFFGKMGEDVAPYSLIGGESRFVLEKG